MIINISNIEGQDGLYTESRRLYTLRGGGGGGGGGGVSAFHFIFIVLLFVSNLMRWLPSDGRIYRRALLLRAPIVRTRYCHIANFGIPHINYLEIMFFYNKLNKHQKGKTIDFL